MDSNDHFTPDLKQDNQLNDQSRKNNCELETNWNEFDKQEKQKKVQKSPFTFADEEVMVVEEQFGNNNLISQESYDNILEIC